jgi:predicted nucleic acid-binding protein
MVAHNAIPVERYDFDESDRVFLDANIWMFIYGPPQRKDKTSVYSSALRRLLDARSRIFIDLLVISEMINSYARLKWKLIAPECRFKTFRNSPEFADVAEEIADYVDRSVKLCSRIENNYQSFDLSALMGEYRTGGFDFNDQVICGLCRNRGWKLITDDGDFDTQGITILTANARLLRSRN